MKETEYYNESDLWGVLKSKGLDILTGEACGYSMRLLCDITPELEDLLSEYLGGSIEFNQDAWNHRNGAIHSVMLARSMITDLSIFALLHEYELVVSYNMEKQGLHNQYRAYPTRQDFENELVEHTWLNDCIERSWYGQKQSRNVHQFSGRKE